MTSNNSLPPPITRLYNGILSHKPSEVAAPFTDTSIMIDEAKLHVGPSSVKVWAQTALVKHKATVSIQNIKKRTDSTIIVERLWTGSTAVVDPPANLLRILVDGIDVRGVYAGTKGELEDLVWFVAENLSIQRYHVKVCLSR